MITCQIQQVGHYCFVLEKIHKVRFILANEMNDLQMGLDVSLIFVYFLADILLIVRLTLVGGEFPPQTKVLVFLGALLIGDHIN
jgi:hypothetical protein